VTTLSEFDAALLIKQARQRSGLTQRALADRAGTSQSVVARIELGETSPTVGTLNRLLRASGLRAVVTLRPSPRSRRPDVSDDQIAERIRRFFSAPPVSGVASVYLFGSSARGARHRQSDVDVAVLLDAEIHRSKGDRGEVRVRLSAEIAAATGINEVDLLILNDLPPMFARTIVIHGIRLLRPNPQLDRAFVRDVQLRAADVEPFLRRMRRIKLARLRG
jgi:transcriptional regulator with XRE-family HTH domain